MAKGRDPGRLAAAGGLTIQISRGSDSIALEGSILPGGATNENRRPSCDGRRLGVDRDYGRPGRPLATANALQARS